MNRATNLFMPDARNHGGNKELEDIMHIHHAKMLKIKPVLKLTAPHPHVGSHKKGMLSSLANKVELVTQYQKKNMQNTFKALGTKKGLIDAQTPKTFGLIKKLSTNKKVKTFAATEHMKNLASLQERLNRVSTASVLFFLNH